MTEQYTLINLEEERQNGYKWIVGPFQPEGSSRHSKAIEIGYVNLQEVEETDQLHLHTYTEEYYLLLSGYMRVRVGEGTVEASEGQVLLVRPNVPHLILEVQPGTRVLLIKAPAGPNDKTVLSETELRQ